MSRRSARGRSPQVLSELAQKIKNVASSEVTNKGTTVTRWKVKQAKPLLIEEVEGDLVLEEGDPDFTIGDSLRQHIASYGLEEGDQVLVVRSGEEWHAFDAASNTTPEASAELEAGSYTITGDTPTHTLNVATATVKDVANVLATVIRDLGGA